VPEPVQLAELTAALELGPHELVGLVGGGGKTTALFALGRQLGGTVVLTTTTKMGRDRTDGFAVRVGPSDDELEEALAEHGRVLAWGAAAGQKAIGVTAARCDHWFDLADHVVVEADGSRRLPCKAPGPFEPVLPARTTMAIACVGAGAFGRVIADRCHRPLRVAALAGCSPYERLTPPRLARVLRSERGGRRGVPPGTRFVVLLARVTAADRTFVDDLVGGLGAVDVVAVAPAHPSGFT
jgi:probable selenium-dependent hydroxylase accessory protein YqeC